MAPIPAASPIMRCPIWACSAPQRQRADLLQHLWYAHTDQERTEALADLAVIVTAAKTPTGQYLAEAMHAALTHSS